MPAAQRPLGTGLYDPEVFTGPDAAASFRRVSVAGARFVRISVDWAAVTPAGNNAPQNFDQSNPSEPRYHFGTVDQQVRAAVAAGLEPILDVWDAPLWTQHSPGRPGQDGPSRPSQDSFGQFVRAVALRYSGSYGGLPRVQYWECWNEPNVSIYLIPQFDATTGAPVSPDLYRDLLNQFTDNVKAVHPSNVVLAGSLAPFTVKNRAVTTMGPLAFLRLLLCVGPAPAYRSTCNGKVAFDVLSFHPYTSGSPAHHATGVDDLSLGDIPKLRPILSAARREGHLLQTGPIRYAITEIGWNSNPPDPTSVPIALQARWTAEALYRTWTDGVTIFAWLLIRDQPLPRDLQSGLWFAGATFAQDRPKPTLTAFRFPFVAYRRGTGAAVWGRTPTSRAGSVLLQLRAGGAWRPRAVLQAGTYGIFQGTVPVPAGTRFLRARYAGATSLAFSLVVPPNENLNVSPFGASGQKLKTPAHG